MSAAGDYIHRRQQVKRNPIASFSVDDLRSSARDATNSSICQPMPAFDMQLQFPESSPDNGMWQQSD